MYPKIKLDTQLKQASINTTWMNTYNQNLINNKPVELVVVYQISFF